MTGFAQRLRHAAFVIAALLGFALLIAPAAHAQGGNTGNGGELTELDLKLMAMKLPYYIGQPQMRGHFPEIDLRKFHKLAASPDLNIGIVEEELYDKKGRPRSGKNLTVGGKPTILIQRNAIKKYNRDNHKIGIVYTFLFHELLNLMGLELTDDLPFERDDDPAFFSSIYPISSRILLTADEIEAFKPLELDYSKFRIHCQDETTKGDMQNYSLTLDPMGNIEFRSIPIQMFMMEDKHPRRANRYNDRIRRETVNPKRVLYGGVLPGFRLDAFVKIHALVPQTHRYGKRFKTGFLEFEGQFTLSDRLERQIEGQIVVTPSDEHGWPKSNGTVLFRCHAVPAR